VNDLELSELKIDLAQLIASIDIIAMNRDIVALAKGSFPTIVKSLDAIHVASALLWQKNHADVAILSHDKSMLTLAAALNFKTIGQT